MENKSFLNSFKLHHLFYVANMITIGRILLAIPLYLTLKTHNLKFVLVIVVLGILSDYMDGYFARKRNEVSEFGKILDPIADKIIIITTTLALMSDYGLPAWLGLTIIIRDIIIIIGSVFLSTRIKMVNPSNIIGKITVNVIAFTLIFYMFRLEMLIPAATWISLLFILISLVSYLIDGIKKYRL